MESRCRNTIHGRERRYGMELSSIKKDRFFNGFIAGLLGGIVPFAFNFGSRALGFTTLVWADFMGAFTMGNRPEGIFEVLFFIGVQFVFLGLLGAIFALILPFITSRRYLFKGALYGTTLWFLLFRSLTFCSCQNLRKSPLRLLYLMSLVQPFGV